MSILGGIVVGQSAVTANLISPAVVVIVSLAGLLALSYLIMILATQYELLDLL